MSNKGPKVGRTAHQMLREQAEDFVRNFRPVLTSSDGRYCLNPHDAPKQQMWVTTSQALEVVLDAMENFAKTGKFVAEIDVELIHIKASYRALIKAGMKREAAKAELIDRFHKSPSTIDRAIQGIKEEDAALAERMKNISELQRASIEPAKKLKGDE